MTKRRNSFFQELRKATSVASDTTHIQELIEQISLLKSAFEDELERTTAVNDKDDLQAAIVRSKIRIETLHKIKDKHPVSAENLELLLEYGKNRDKPEIANYRNVIDQNPKILSPPKLP